MPPPQTLIHTGIFHLQIVEGTPLGPVAQGNHQGEAAGMLQVEVAVVGSHRAVGHSLQLQAGHHNQGTTWQGLWVDGWRASW